MRKYLLFVAGWLCLSFCLLGQEAKVGAFILVSEQGGVNYEKGDGSPAEGVSIGKPIPLSYTIITGKGAKLVGLLSNGTLLTLEEETRMKVETFKQEPFESDGKKLTDLPGEPSSSKVMLNLDFGSLVVKTKKLNKGSVFDINSPVGVAGIRGTEFQMASRPGQGVQLDVTESTVAWTPPGGVPMPVTQGKGLSVSQQGVPKLRPVNPTVARKIETTNKTATEATQEVSLGEVAVAMDQSAQEVEAVEESPAQERETEEQSTDDASAEESDAELENKESNSQEEQPAEESSAVEESAPSEESPPAEESPPTEESQTTESNSPAEESSPTEESGSTAQDASPKEEAAKVEESSVERTEEVGTTESASSSEPVGQSEPEVKEAKSSPKEGKTSTEKVKEEDTGAGPAKSNGTQKNSEDTGNPKTNSDQGVVSSSEEGQSFAQQPASSPGKKEDVSAEQPMAPDVVSTTSSTNEGSPSPKTPKSVATPEASEKSNPAPSSAPSQPSSPTQPNAPAKAPSPSKPDTAAPTPAKPDTPVPAKPTMPKSTGSNLSDVTRMVQDSDPDIALERELKKHKLTDSQKARFDTLTPATQSKLKELKTPVVQRLTKMAEVGESETAAFLRLGERARELVFGLEDSVMSTLLQQDIDEELLVESLAKMNMSFPTPADVPNFAPVLPTDDKLQNLSTKLRENGKGWVMDELYKLSEGDLTEEWIEKGEHALLLLKDYNLDEFSPGEVIAANKALNNPFYMEISSLFKEIALDELVSGEGSLLGGDNLIINDNAQAMQPYFGDGVDEVILSATKSLSIKSDFEWEAPGSNNNARLVMMSGGNFSVPEGVSLRSATSDLVIATWSQLSLREVELHGAREVSILGMRDVQLDNVRMEASTLAKIKARRDLDVNVLTFRPDISRIVMEATTMRLRNVTFPAAAQVRLNSSLGGIDGRYPNFGNVSAAQQIGRVNFIENVKSGGNLLNNRNAFDQHGKNIEIGRIKNP